MAYLRTGIGIGVGIIWQQARSLGLKIQKSIIAEGPIVIHFITEDGKYIVGE